MYHLTSIHQRSEYDHTKQIFVNSYPWLFLQNVLNNGKNIGNCDQTCIIHLEVGKRVMNQSLVSITATKIRLLMNVLYCKRAGQENNKTVNPFSTRMMPLRRPEGEIT